MSNLDYGNRFVTKIGVCVLLKHNESLSDLLRRFKKKFLKSGLSIEMRERTFYEKPSVKKKRKRILAMRRRKREEAKQFKNIGKRKIRKKPLIRGDYYENSSGS